MDGAAAENVAGANGPGTPEARDSVVAATSPAREDEAAADVARLPAGPLSAPATPAPTPRDATPAVPPAPPAPPALPAPPATPALRTPSGAIQVPENVAATADDFFGGLVRRAGPRP